MVENDSTLNVSELCTSFRESVAAIEDLKNRPELSRKTVHDVNNALAKISNALWLIEYEQDPDSENFQQYRQLIEQEIDTAKQLLQQNS